MGKGAARRQAAAMRQMNQMAQEQFDYYKGKQEAQEVSVAEQRASFEDFKFENPFAGMENVMEDLTVDQQAARFQAQQGTQQRANILEALRGGAGASGIAGLAQSLANQGALQAQQISASVGQQEAMNQRLAAQGAMQVQQLERQGAAAVQQAEFGRESTLLGAEYGLLAGANQGVQQAMANQMSGMGMQAQMYGSQAAAGASMFGNIASAALPLIFPSDRRLKKNINLIGKSPSGLNIYNFEYIDSKYGEGLFQGVMSDEIPQEAVVTMDNGYDAVDYSMLDVEFKQI